MGVCIISNDNDTGGRSYEERLYRINNALFAYEFPSDKLASFMQMEDLFPLRYDTNKNIILQQIKNRLTVPSLSLYFFTLAKTSSILPAFKK